MTLIAFTAGRTSAEAMYDSTSYAGALTSLGHTSKMLHLPHIDTAVLGQGDSTFVGMWHYSAIVLSDESPDLDYLIQKTPEVLRGAWSQCPKIGGRSIAFLVGYSPNAGRFVAYEFPSDRDFAPHRVDGLFVFPSPLTARPSGYELRGMRDVGVHVDDLAFLRSRDPLPIPGGRPDWADLAHMVRERSYLHIDTRMKVHVGGGVFHTRLERGSAQTTKIAEFNQDPEDFFRAVSGTLHPQSQLGPCDCGSGLRFLDCCLVPYLDQPCWCGSDDALRECCMVQSGNSTTESVGGLA